MEGCASASGPSMLCSEEASEVAHKWADWLHNPCRLGSPTLQSGGQNQKWPTSGQIGYITPAVWGSPTLRSREANQQNPRLASRM